MLLNLPNDHDDFETRYEWLRPGQLRERQRECSLVFFPVAPLEYHGPHMPVGTDILNAAMVAHEVCRQLRKGVVRPALSLGTERERDPDMTQYLGFDQDDYVVGMDFPARLWNSHYLPEEIFGAVLAAELELLIGQGYRYIMICNGHGAINHGQVIQRLCIRYSNTTDCQVEYCTTVPTEVFEQGLLGHADISETSLMKFFKPDSVDLSALPHRDQPLVYQQFSVVDGPGFTADYASDRTVHQENDPREATEEFGKQIFEQTIKDILALIEKKFRISKEEAGRTEPVSGTAIKKPLRVSG